MKHISVFGEISKDDVGVAGGKGASLGEMAQANIPVPEGFVILRTAFDRFIEENDLNIEIDAVLSSVDIDNVYTVEDASKKILGMILSKEIPEYLSVEILENFKELNSEFVAVRSSATSEDSADAAWAGQLDTFLNTNRENLIENIRKCWASLFTPRAIFYRFEKKLDKQKISVAVVIQKMIDSKKSGIAFSVHPVTEDYNQIIIEACFGLGETIVSGSITPDSYVIDKRNWKILDSNVNVQSKGLFGKSGGGNEWKDLGEKGSEQVLSDEEIVELSKLIVKIEDHYGFPCDIEWTKAEGGFFITQSRPITTLDKKEKEFDIIFSDLKENIFEKHMVFPNSPLLYLDSIGRGYVNNPIFKKFGIKNYYGLVRFLNGGYEDWQKISVEKLVKKDDDIERIILYALRFLEGKGDYFNEDTSKYFKDAKNVAVFLREVDRVSIELNQFFLFFMEDLLETSDEVLLKKLPEVRDKISKFVGDCLFKSYDKVLDFLTENYDVSKDVAWLFTAEEILDILEGKLKISDIDRKIGESVVIISSNKYSKIFFGEDALKVRDFMNSQNPDTENIKKAISERRLNGSCAFHGMATGMVV
ncbi:MAG TPA: hypothetical protein ENH20_00050, partial [Candidatus Pacearchaeota archaeon]|nr:hypothetical protein [Candidatus Pacearchaeota archaeon]